MLVYHIITSVHLCKIEDLNSIKFPEQNLFSLPSAEGQYILLYSLLFVDLVDSIVGGW